jgi:hypothetical protein
MKFTSSAIVLFAASASAFVHPSQRRAFVSLQSTATEEEKAPSKKEERLRFMKSEQFHRKGFKEVREDVEEVMKGQFNSGLVNELKTSQYVMEREGVKVHLAKVRLVDTFLDTLYDRVRNRCLNYNNEHRTLDSAGESNDPLLWPTKPLRTFQAKLCTSLMNSFTTQKLMTTCQT